MSNAHEWNARKPGSVPLDEVLAQKADEGDVRDSVPPMPVTLLPVPIDYLGRAGAYSAATLMGQTFPPLVYLVEGMLTEGLTVIAGTPKVGKSWLLLQLAAALAAGENALGTLPTGRARPVLYLALEDGPRRLQDRLRLLGLETPSPRLFFVTSSVTESDLPAMVGQWMTECSGQQPVVILDTLGRVMRPARAGETAYARDYEVMVSLKEIADREPGSAVVVVHHTRKSEAVDFLDMVSGTQGIAGGADSVVVLQRARSEAVGSISVTSRDAKEGQYSVRFEEGRWTLDGDTLAEASASYERERTVQHLGERSADIVEYVNTATNPVDAGEVAEVLGMSRDDAGRYLRRAAEAGRIVKAARGRYTPVRSVRVSDSHRPNGHTDTTDTRLEKQ